MPRGGARPNAGRKKSAPEQLPKANKNIATKVLAMASRLAHQDNCSCEICLWWGLLNAPDARVRLDTLKYLTDKRDGKPVQHVNHIHDKPVELNVNLSMSEVVRKVRERRLEYERSR